MDANDIRALLSRISIAPTKATLDNDPSYRLGEIIVANIWRTLLAGILTPEAVIDVLAVWLARINELEPLSPARNLSRTEVLKATETEWMASVDHPLHDLLMSQGVFSKAPCEEDALLHVKTLESALQYVFYEAQDQYGELSAIDISENVDPSARARTRLLLTNRLNDLTDAQIRAKRGTAMLSGRFYAWVTRKEDLEHLLGEQLVTHDSVAPTVAKRTLELLGLVHLSHPSSKSGPVTGRFLVAFELAYPATTAITKSSFVFSDRNPRFVAWDDAAAVLEKNWGNGLDLSVFDQRKSLAKGAPEAIILTPQSMDMRSFKHIVALGHYDSESWGSDDANCRDNDLFAKELRSTLTASDVIERIVDLLFPT